MQLTGHNSSPWEKLTLDCIITQLVCRADFCRLPWALVHLSGYCSALLKCKKSADRNWSLTTGWKSPVDAYLNFKQFLILEIAILGNLVGHVLFAGGCTYADKRQLIGTMHHFYCLQWHMQNFRGNDKFSCQWPSVLTNDFIFLFLHCNLGSSE